MILKHFSHVPLPPLNEAQPRPQADLGEQGGGAWFSKPRGLWVSVEGPDSWEEWCTSEDFPLGHLVYEVVLAPQAEVLLLDTPWKLRDLTRDYGEMLPPPLDFHPAINWPRLAGLYQGIIITPYQWECRLEDDTNWYYGWDCASGCIWDPAAVQSITLVEERELKPIKPRPSLAEIIATLKAPEEGKADAS